MSEIVFLSNNEKAPKNLGAFFMLFSQNPQKWGLTKLQ